MSASPSITPQDLLDALIDKSVISGKDLTSLLGEKRRNPTINVIEMTLVRQNILSNDDLLAIKHELSGLPVLNDPAVRVTARLPEELARRCGALLVSRQPVTVAMVEDRPENIDAVAAAIGHRNFEVWLITAPQFAHLARGVYSGEVAQVFPAAPDLATVLDHAIAMRASDVHLKVGVPPALRIDGRMHTLNYQPTSQSWLKAQISAIVEPRHAADLERKFSTDLAYAFGFARFRVNIAFDSDGPTMVLRKLPAQIPTFDDIGAPDAIRRFAGLERGLVLVTGPTGSGKSTTLAAILNEIITSSSRHVITLEDPIEFRFPTDRASVVNQRELGASFASFADGLRDALRQDPDVILIGELRDRATLSAALTSAETGHMVFGTLHTASVPQTVARVVNTFDADEQPGVRVQLAQMLKGIVSQTLVPRASGKGRVAAFEILVSNPATQTNLRKVDGANQLRQTMQTSVHAGMSTIDRALARLVLDGSVTRAEAEFRAYDIDEFNRQLAHARQA